jgi:dephospho-CoA kinase
MMQKGAIGLTGGIACGKSSVADVLKRDGIPVLDTDAIAHAMLKPDHEIFAKVVETFGREYVDDDGLIDRRKLGALVFGDAVARKKLNAIIHPEIFSVMHEWLGETLKNNRNALVVVPLLYETAVHDRFEKILVVAADMKNVVERLSRRGLTTAEAEARIASQLPLAQKVARADGVIWNNGDLSDLVAETRRIWNKIILGKEE